MTNNILNKTNSSICSICLSNIDTNSNSNIIIITDCNHIFHASCLLPWANNNNSCPNCRKTISLDLNKIQEFANDNLDDIIDNIMSNNIDIHEDLVYYMLIKELSIIVKDIKNNINNNFIPTATDKIL